MHRHIDDVRRCAEYQAQDDEYGKADQLSRRRRASR
jgi:hypothetical protein